MGMRHWPFKRSKLKYNCACALVTTWHCPRWIDREASKRTAKRTLDHRTEFLLEFQGSKRLFDVTNLFETCEMVQCQLKALRVKAKVVLASEMSPDSAAGPDGASTLLLQRWSSKWEAFVDANSSVDLSNGDRLTVVPRPRFQSPEPPPEKVTLFRTRVGRIMLNSF